MPEEILNDYCPQATNGLRPALGSYDSFEGDFDYQRIENSLVNVIVGLVQHRIKERRVEEEAIADSPDFTCREPEYQARELRLRQQHRSLLQRS